jgi:thioesterase domain-containing protein
MPGPVTNLSNAEQRNMLVSLLSQKAKREFPLSLAQQRLWFLHQLNPGSSAYNVAFGIRLKGNLDVRALELSAQQIVDRHEILRTSFRSDAGSQVQVVAADSVIEIPVLDLRDVALNDRQSEAYAIGTTEAQVPFNLATGPVLRLKLVRTGVDEHLLICVMHHIVCDGWSLEIFVHELATVYEQNSKGRIASISALALQYGDFAQWQREWIAGDRLASQVRYWKQRLSGASACLPLPADHARPSERSDDGASQAILVPKELIHNLTVLGRTSQATLFMVMLAAFKTLLHSSTAAEDMLVGVPVAGRNRVEFENLIGFFVNTVVMRTNLGGNPHFSDLLLQEREVALDAFAHADLPFERLVEELNPPRTLSYNPVVQVMFSIVRARKLPRFGEVLASAYAFASQTSKFDLSMDVIEDAEERWWLRIEYSTSLFSHERVAEMLEQYLMLLKAIAMRPQLQLSELASILQGKGYITPRNLVPQTWKENDGTTSSNRRIVESHLAELAPGDALEQILVRIWERTLGTSPIRVNEDFFDLGGHSLLAAHLVSEVERVVGREVPLSTLFRGPTIKSFAELIRQGTAWCPDPLLVEMSAGNSGPPLFAIAESGVDTTGYALLARHLEAGQPFYKLQSHASTCSIVPYSIDEFRTLAREYIGAMRAIQPLGPYFLIGMCNGVHIAEQMVLELERQGREVALFAIIDTYVMQHSNMRWLAWFESARMQRRYISQMPISHQFSYYGQAVRTRLRRVIQRETVPLSPWTKAVWPGKDFRIPRFRAPVLLFKRVKQPYFKVRDPEMGWGARSATGVRICALNIAMHEEMLREPAVRTLAKKLAEAFAEQRSLLPKAALPRSNC